MALEHRDMIYLKTVNTELRQNVAFLMNQNAKLINLMDHLSTELKIHLEEVAKKADQTSTAAIDEHARDIAKIGCGRGRISVLKVSYDIHK